MLDPKTVTLVFASGKLVCAGTKKESEVYRSVNNLYVMLGKELGWIRQIDSKFYKSRKLARPIEQIRQGLISFNKGNVVKIKPHGKEELRKLIEQFNYMVEPHSNSKNIISKSEEKSE